MAERGIDSALLDRIVQEVVRRLRGEMAAAGVSDAGFSAAAAGVKESRESASSAQHGPCRGWEQCPFRARRTETCGKSGLTPPPEHNAAPLWGRVIVEEDIKRALRNGARTIRIDRGAIVTPLARDAAREKGLAIERVDS